MTEKDTLSTKQIRKDFPALSRTVEGRSIVYLDSAATSLKPTQVINALSEFYLTCVGSVNRSVNQFGREVTVRYREARHRVAQFIGSEEDEIVFVRNSTEAFNLVAASHPSVRNGNIISTLANHHSSLLPWSLQNQQHAPLNLDGTLSIAGLYDRLAERPALLCIPHVSNAMGLLLPIQEAIEMARSVDTLVFIDGAQSVPHIPTDVRKMDCDFLAFSGHKMLAPFGIGVLYAKWAHLASMSPFLLGGDMVESVHVSDFTLKEPPEKFEAGTPNVGGAVALAAAIDYLEDIGLDRVHRHVSYLTRLARSRLREIEGLKVYGPDTDEVVVSAVSFGFPGMTAHALSRLLSDRFGIIVRSGFHCAQPLHETLSIPATVRASFYLYNTEEDVDALAMALRKIRETISGT